MDLKISNFKLEPESTEYEACQFELNGLNVISRSSKVTPKKAGQFVTFWKRIKNGPIAPFNENDNLDLFIVNVRTDTHFGQFVFPKSVLIKKGVISTISKEGKRALRVYPSWDVTKNKRAKRTQLWQLKFFFEIGSTTDFKKVEELYSVWQKTQYL